MAQSIDPRTVVSPKTSVRKLNVVFDGESWDETNPQWSGWSLAKLEWDGAPSVGVRWNGEVGEGVGSPQSRGLPTWFILPEPLAVLCLAAVDKHLRGGDADEEQVSSPRQRLRDLISFVRAASDEELARMLDEMGLRAARGA